MAYNFLDKLKNNLSRSSRVLKSLPSRLLFGNLQTMSNNIKPLLNKDVNFKSDNEIIKKGFKKYTNKCDYEIITKIFNKYNFFINDKNNSISTPNKKKKFVKDPLKNIPEIKLILPTIKEILNNYYKDGFIIDQVKAWRNFSDDMYYEKKKNYIYSNIWHFDEFQIDKLNIFILLNDGINPETGATRILDIETTKKIIRSFTFLDTSIKMTNMEKNIKLNNQINYLEGNLGDICLFNATRCLHAASIPKPGTMRDVIQFEVYPYRKNSFFKKNNFSFSEDMYIKKLSELD